SRFTPFKIWTVPSPAGNSRTRFFTSSRGCCCEFMLTFSLGHGYYHRVLLHHWKYQNHRQSPPDHHVLNLSALVQWHGYLNRSAQGLVLQYHRLARHEPWHVALCLVQSAQFQRQTDLGGQGVQRQDDCLETIQFQDVLLD